MVPGGCKIREATGSRLAGGLSMRNVVIYHLGTCGMSEGNKGRTVSSMKHEESGLNSLGIIVSSFSVQCKIYKYLFIV